MALREQQLKVLNLSTCDYGGAGMATVVFNKFLNDAGYKSLLMVFDSKGNFGNVKKYNRRGSNYISYKIRKWHFKSDLKGWKRLCRNNGFNNSIVFDNQISVATAKEIVRQAGFTPDVILIHWTHNFITPEIVSELREITDAKIVSVMMDNASITGGCHYPFNCNGYAEGCKECMLFKKHTTLPATILSRKLANFPKDMEFWATSPDCLRVEKSLLGVERRAYPILFPIDETIFPEKDKRSLREEYSIAETDIMLMLGCTSFNAGDSRKGLEYLISLLITIKERHPELQERIVLLVVGDNNIGIFEHLGYRTMKMGYLPMAKLMEVYKISDMFVSTSVEDSGPLMVNQAMAVGTPVASFKIGVAEDLVEDGVTGVKANLYDFSTLADKVAEYLLSGKDYSRDCLLKYAKIKENLSPLKQLERIAKSRV